MNKKVIYLIVPLFLILAITAGCSTSVSEYPKEILVNYNGNIPRGTFKASIGDNEVFTNGDIVSVTLYEKDGVMKDLCKLGSDNQYFCPFELGINISGASAEKQAKITSGLDIIKQNGTEFLSKNLVLSVNGQTYEELRISPELKGIKQINLRISGVGNGGSRQDAIQDAAKKSNELLNILLDKPIKEGTELSNPNQCKEDITNFVKENPSLSLQTELEIYCGSEKIGNSEVLADSSTGYKYSIMLNYENHQFNMGYYPYLRGAMKWLKENTNKNANIMAWWDYGTMINVFAERETIVSIPSKEILKYEATTLGGNSSWAVSGVKLADDNTIKKIARVFTTGNSSEAIKIMKEFNAKYVLVPLSSELGKFPVLYDVSYGKWKFIKADNSDLREGEEDKESIIYKSLHNQPISGFNKVYSDENAVIYEIII